MIDWRISAACWRSSHRRACWFAETDLIHFFDAESAGRFGQVRFATERRSVHDQLNSSLLARERSCSLVGQRAREFTRSEFQSVASRHEVLLQRPRSKVDADQSSRALRKISAKIRECSSLRGARALSAFFLSLSTSSSLPLARSVQLSADGRFDGARE